MDFSSFSPALVLVTVVSLALAPFVAVMVTSFTKIVVVLSLLRNALGLQQVPPNVVINGLAIVDEEADLEDYYLGEVIAGAAAFVIVADGFADFAAAMRLKLLREITPMNQAQLSRMRPAGESTN